LRSRATDALLRTKIEREESEHKASCAHRGHRHLALSLLTMAVSPRNWQTQLWIGIASDRFSRSSNSYSISSKYKRVPQASIVARFGKQGVKRSSTWFNCGARCIYSKRRWQAPHVTHDRHVIECCAGDGSHSQRLLRTHASLHVRTECSNRYICSILVAHSRGGRLVGSAFLRHGARRTLMCCSSACVRKREQRSGEIRTIVRLNGKPRTTSLRVKFDEMSSRFKRKPKLPGREVAF